MPYRIVDRFKRGCTKCGRERAMALVEHELGRREEMITLWCACPQSDLFEITYRRIDAEQEGSRGEPEIDPEPPKRRPV